MANRMITYGYGMHDGELVAIQAEAIIVERIFMDYIDGKLLAEIADELTRENIEYFMGNCQWNKNRIARIIDNEKYIGADGYPQIINDDDFVYARRLKESKGAKKIHFDEETDYLRNNNVTCAQCGSPIRRISKWRSREKWMCRRGCGNKIYLSDSVIFGGIDNVIYRIFQNPDNATPIREDEISCPELKRCQNEVSRMFSSKTLTFTGGKKLIFELAQLKFSVGNNKVPDVYTDMLVEDCARIVQQERVDKAFIEKHIKKISIDKDGYVIVRFNNGAELTNKEEVEACKKDQE